MFSDLAEIRAHLKTRLEPHANGWRIVDELSTPVDATVPVLYFEYTEIVSSVNGQPLGRDTVGARIDLVLASAGKSDEDGADAHVLQLGQALQQFSDIYWDAATKIRLDNGAYAWRVPVTVLSTYTPPADPTPEPPADPEE